jgi:hypothetical protein
LRLPFRGKLRFDLLSNDVGLLFVVLDGAFDRFVSLRLRPGYVEDDRLDEKQSKFALVGLAKPASISNEIRRSDRPFLRVQCI